jgi:hypothetical protein
MNRILTQKWFLLQDIKDYYYFRNGVFNNKEWNSAVVCLAEFRQKFRKLNSNWYMQPEILSSQPKFQRFI